MITTNLDELDNDIKYYWGWQFENKFSNWHNQYPRWDYQALEIYHKTTFKYVGGFPSFNYYVREKARKAQKDHEKKLYYYSGIKFPKVSSCHVEFYDNLLEKSNNGITPAESLDMLYAYIDDFLQACIKYECPYCLSDKDMNSIFNIDVAKFSTGLLVGLLIITLVWKTFLTDRPKFYLEVENELQSRYDPDKTGALLKGLK